MTSLLFLSNNWVDRFAVFTYTGWKQKMNAARIALLFALGAVSQIESVFKKIHNDFQQLDHDLVNIEESMHKIWELVLTNESTKKIHR